MEQPARPSSPHFGLHIESRVAGKALTISEMAISSPESRNRSLEDSEEYRWSPQHTGQSQSYKPVNVVPLLRIPVSRRVRSPEWPLGSLSSRSSRGETGSHSPSPGDSQKAYPDEGRSELGSGGHASTLWPTFGCAVADPDSGAPVAFTRTTPESVLDESSDGHWELHRNRGRTESEPDLHVDGVTVQEPRTAPKADTGVPQDLGGPGSSEPCTLEKPSRKTCQDAPLPPLADAKKHCACPASGRAIEMLRTGTRLTLAESDCDGASDTSVSEPGSRSSGIHQDGIAECCSAVGGGGEGRPDECSPQREKCSCPSECVDSYSGKRGELEEGEVFWTEGLCELCSVELAQAREAKRNASQEVQTRVSRRSVAVQAHVARVEEKTQTRRQARCHRGISCNLAKRITSLTEEAMKEQNTKLTRQLDYHVTAERTLLHELQRERQLSQQLLEARETAHLFSEELLFFVSSTSCALVETKAALEHQRAVAETLKDDRDTLRQTGRRDIETLQQDHLLLLNAIQRQLKSAKDELLQLEHQKGLETCRYQREVEIAKQHAQGLEAHYTSQVLHMQRSQKQTEEALAQAQDEILRLRGESREKDISYSRKLHETESQSRTEQIQREASEKAYRLSAEKELLSCRLEIDRLQMRLDHAAEKLAVANQAHAAELRALKESNAAEIRQKTAEHDAALRASRRRERETQELAYFHVEDLKSRAQMQQQAWEQERSRSDLALATARRQCTDAEARVEELEALPPQYEESIRKLQKQVDDLTAARHHSAAELASLLDERQNLLEALQSLTAEHNVVRKDAECMKDRLLRAISDRDEALRRAEAYAVDEITNVRALGMKIAGSCLPDGGPKKDPLVRSYVKVLQRCSLMFSGAWYRSQDTSPIVY